MDYRIHTLPLTDEWKICPLCGYKDGFHSMLRKDEGAIRWLFICPSCHEVFDVGRILKE